MIDSVVCIYILVIWNLWYVATVQTTQDYNKLMISNCDNNDDNCMTRMQADDVENQPLGCL